MSTIVKEADFNNYDDEHRIVRLSESHGKWEFSEMYAVLCSAYKCNLQRVTPGGKVKQWDMSLAEMDALCEAWTQYKADRMEAHRNIE